ncbi:hypothetical protein E6C70_01415 [Glaciibacter flavus]|uniref:Four-carbon acid sugar kinase family protein n=1 Tax=Orlajensenia flava TaxID=2565934 RepID=A0A4S4FYR3_9MICO|nr:four-carbon acid sugar kinase family protein [Glaciibacter flavus]THG36220.1 hypothetical protein E6C70_01415 [Glaciibacter flavus]
MKTVVLDDDPTGTQSATGVRVLLESSAALIADALRAADSVYVQTNSRAIDEAEAVALVTQVRTDALEAGRTLGEEIAFVLRGDSTLRGHVFAETEVFLEDGAVMVFVPAFPAGGRRTRGGVHYVETDGVEVPAHETEYADDPVFPFSTADLTAYVEEKSGRAGIRHPLDDLRRGPDGLAAALASAPAGAVVVPDAESDEDIRTIAAGIRSARDRGARLVVRSASPLAAELAGVASSGLLDRPLIDRPRATLLACGSHTSGATAQIDAVADRWGHPEQVDTDLALTDPQAAGTSVADDARRALLAGGLAFITSARTRSSAHNTLRHGELVMQALTTAVRELLPDVSVVVSKGGITSAEVARVGIGARSATVLGQVLPGVSVWSMETHDGRSVLYVVVPGNVGGPSTLVDVLEALSVPSVVNA